MCVILGYRKWGNVRRVASYYLVVENRKYQYRLLNPTPFYCITGYIMENAVAIVDMALKRMPQKRLKLIDGSISSY